MVVGTFILVFAVVGIIVLSFVTLVWRADAITKGKLYAGGMYTCHHGFVPAF